MRTAIEPVHGTSLELHRVMEPDRSRLLALLAESTGCTNPGRFPGSNPCSLERKDFPKLTQQPYFVAEKTNGLRFLMMCCTYQTFSVCVIVDRALNVYLLPLQALPRVMCQGSVLDCELVLNKSDHKWYLLVFDALKVSGVTVGRLAFSARIGAAKRALGAYEWRAGDPVIVRIKYFVPTVMFDTFCTGTTARQTQFDEDGIILVPEYSPAVVGRHTELFKLKQKHTVDFLVGSDGLQLSVYDSRTRMHVSVAKLRETAPVNAIAECLRADDGVWDLVCVRVDKKTANDMLTYDRTLHNMSECITTDELLRLFRSPPVS